MSERMISPAVFTAEKELKFLPQGIAEIGAAFIGPTSKGPAFSPTIVESQVDFENLFGVPSDDSYTSFAVREYLGSAGRATVVRVLGLDGYDSTTSRSVAVTLSGSAGSIPLAIIHPSVSGETIVSASVTGSALNFSLTLSSSLGSRTYSNLSADVASTNYIGNIFGFDAASAKAGFILAEFPRALGAFTSTGSLGVTVAPTTGTLNFSGSVYGTYSNASTPVIQSQTIGGSKHNLFTLSTFGDGNAANRDIKISITNVRTNSSGFGSFSLSVRRFSDIDNKQDILEQYDNLNLNLNSTNYVARRIGDSKISFDANNAPFLDGNYPAQSKYVYITMADGIESIPSIALPFGFAGLLPSFANTFVPATSYITSSYFVPVGASVATKVARTYFGFDFSDRTNLSYLNPIPSGSAAVTGSVGFSLENISAPDLADISNATSFAAAASLRKFTVPFQGGFDGMAPSQLRATGFDITSTNTQGFDLSDAGKSGAKSYVRAINAISNPDEYDVNLIVAPGVIHRLHSYITTKIIEMCENRGDAFYIMDADTLDASVTSVSTSVDGVDTSYAAVYHPWVKIRNDANGKLMWVPLSVVMPAIYAFNDSVAAEWFAPAGLNRGGITAALQVKTRLTHQDRDDLYENRVNPIVTFPGQGIVAFGQKTLQVTPSALDRINVRRLMITVKKFISSTSRYLVFEQNVETTRQKFLNIANPYLSSVQERSGLYAFKVVMDSTNNTPDVIDRNILFGQIWLQPAKTAEFIAIEFNITPTGASFSA